MNALVKKGHEKESVDKLFRRQKRRPGHNAWSQENVVSPRNDRGCIKGTWKMEVRGQRRNICARVYTVDPSHRNESEVQREAHTNACICIPPLATLARHAACRDKNLFLSISFSFRMPRAHTGLREEMLDSGPSIGTEAR